MSAVATKKRKKRKPPALFPECSPRPEGGNNLSPAVREAMVEGCINLCKKLARRIAKTIPGADVDDLEGEAMLACAEASIQWIPDSSYGNSKFSTFAHSYIEKRLRGLATDQREQTQCVHLESWESVSGREEEDGDTDNEVSLTGDDRELLVKIPEPARTAVRLVVFDRRTPDQVAAELGMDVKDVKLILRNAAKTLAQQKEIMGRPSLFLIPPDEAE